MSKVTSKSEYKIKQGLTKQCTAWYHVDGKFVSREVWLNAIQTEAICRKLDSEARQAKVVAGGVALAGIALLTVTFLKFCWVVL